jgi:hypothetical protein
MSKLFEDRQHIIESSCQRPTPSVHASFDAGDLSFESSSSFGEMQMSAQLGTGMAGMSFHGLA